MEAVVVENPCIACGKPFHPDDFYGRGDGTGRYASKCKECYRKSKKPKPRKDKKVSLVCPGCGVKEKEVLESGKRLSYCRECRNERARRSYWKHHQQYRERTLKRWRAKPFATKRTTWLKNKYGIDHSEYMRMFESQGGVCAICGNPETTKNSNGVVNLLAVDHDHTTGKVRGLLCATCNKSLGGMYDDLDRIMSMYNYLKKHKDESECWSK